MQIRHSCKRERTKEGGAIQKIKRERETLVMQKSGSNSNSQRSFRYKKQEFQNMDQINTDGDYYDLMQKAYLLGTTKIIRKVLAG